MKEEILSRDFDLGFSGNSEDVVMRALHLLGNCINVTSSANRNGEFTIAPRETVPALFELNFYSNGLFHVFIPDALIGTPTSSSSSNPCSPVPRRLLVYGLSRLPILFFEIFPAGVLCCSL